MKKEKKPQLLFNGHTWIIVLVSIIALTTLGIAEGILLWDLYKSMSDTAVKTLEIGAMGSIPLQVIYGIVKIVKLTITGKDDNVEVVEIETKEKE